MKRVAVAGASGFVGSSLIRELAKNYKVIALTRGDIPKDSGNPNIEWRKCDLFSLLETEQALLDADFGVYLVHSMLPSAQLTQGSFSNLDLLVADNFSRAAEISNLEQIIYLGGIIPLDQKLSSHLKSRMEVETSLASYKTPVTTLRAGMILGAGGSSMNIMLHLVKRLPFMVCPKWTLRKSRPVYIDDVVESIKYVLGKSESYSKFYDLAGPTTVNYREMMVQAGLEMGKNLKTISVPFVSPQLSRLWVTLITGAPNNLIAPLIATLKNDMLPDKEHLLKIPGHTFLGYREALEKAMSNEKSRIKKPRAFTLPEAERRKKTVRSVQRLYLPKGKNAGDVANYYMRWLPRHFDPFFKVEIDNNWIFFKAPFIKKSLLILEKSSIRSSSNRQLFYIRGGLLAKIEKDIDVLVHTVVEGRGRLEFRQTYDSRHVLCAIHDYKPTLPWYVYCLTQALLHAWVMKRFDVYLRKKGKASENL